MADTDKKLKITLVRSTIGAVAKNKAIVESMGLRKIGRSIILPDNAATRGQIRLVAQMERSRTWFGKRQDRR